ncbi:TIGR01777 family oxidoreductase [Marinobacterium weihaiense]|uniref:TIGR01777 family oxidoreductase n=1 Tax=Marinobacterium weihaiense TaxID=2851016 RepID=A0ABS6M7V1_9GAMM|nr:TIGR01777 family oxidoreductase [Marinobacterium weihaiense]MBV0932265.1 TIGR01777 family oxidoreductase [Marinobacterium weihaiense]
MRVLITGGSGFIGQALTHALTARGDQVVVLSRSPDRVPTHTGMVCVADLKEVQGQVDAVVNLAGAPIVDKRWTDARKQLLRDSRIETTRRLVDWIEQREQRPSVLVSGSAIGFYGSHLDEVLTESASVEAGFPHELCRDWEQSAMDAVKLGVRVCLIRTGVVLGRGGALSKMLPAFKLGLGGPIGSGAQWMSWIHRDDEVGAIIYLLDNPSLQGPFNLTAPEPVTNEVFSKTLGKVLGRPAFMRVPAVVMKVMLGEASELLVEGQRVVPANLNTAGYTFRYPQLEPALKQVLGQKPS